MEPRRRKRRGSGSATFVRSHRTGLTCHEAGPVVQHRLALSMAAHDEVVLRERFCFAPECRALFFLCPECDRGQRYCSNPCRQQARLRQRRAANRRHQQSPEGRLDHRDRQRHYRERCRQAGVTDHGSISIACSASSSCEPDPVLASTSPCRPQLRHRPTIRLCCRVCGRSGRFIDPFPALPRRR